MAQALVNVRMDQEDRELLDACAAFQKLSKSDIMRLALRQYAARLGVTVTPPPKPRPKRKR